MSTTVDRSPAKGIFLSTVIDKQDDAVLGQNIKGKMMTLISRWNARMDNARTETEFAEVCRADIRFFAQLRRRAVKHSEINREMGFSHQAAQQTVDRVARHDMISVTHDPNSKRDKLVSIAEKEQRWRTFAAKQIRQIETEIGKTIGANAKEASRVHSAPLVGDK